MEILVLGAHKLESRDTRHTCFLIDGVLALDAGSLATALSLSQQAQVQAVLLTHCHFDHIRDLPTLGLATLDQPGSIDVYSLSETLQAIRAHLFNGEVYPDFTERLNERSPKYRFHPIQPEISFRVLDYQVKPIWVSHPAPCTGFIVNSDDGGCIAYTGDTGGSISAFLQDPMCPQVLFVDVSFPSRLTGLAQRTGHLTPSMLREDLLNVLPNNLCPPRLVAVHRSPEYEEEVVSELNTLAEELDIDLTPGQMEMQITVQSVHPGSAVQVPAEQKFCSSIPTF